MVTEWFLVGAGRCGLQLARAMRAQGLVIAGVAARSPASRSRARHALPGVTVAASPEGLSRSVGVLIAVPDQALVEVSTTVAGTIEPGAGVALHTSGVLPGAAMERLGQRGRRVGSLHPLLSFPSGDGPLVRLAGAVAAIEGSRAAVVAARVLARQLEMVPVRVAAVDKPAYHAAAAVAANLVHILVVAARRQLGAAGFTPGQASAALTPLVLGAATAALSARGFEALTGPIARGDAETVAAHLDQLAPEIAEAYRALAEYCLPSLVDDRTLDAAAAKALSATLTNHRPYARLRPMPQRKGA